jgi:hypothetical protein
MTLRFPYLPEPLASPPPPSLPLTAKNRWRPLVKIRVWNSAGQSISFGRVLVDPGADDTLLPLDVASLLNVQLLPVTGHHMRWRGQRYPLRFGRVGLELADDAGSTLRWSATVAFTSATVRYPLLGICGCLEYLDVKFLGFNRILEVEPNSSFPTSVTA